MLKKNDEKYYIIPIVLSQNRLKISANNEMSDRNPSLISKNYDKPIAHYRLFLNDNER